MLFTHPNKSNHWMVSSLNSTKGKSMIQDKSKVDGTIDAVFFLGSKSLNTKSMMMMMMMMMMKKVVLVIMAKVMRVMLIQFHVVSFLKARLWLLQFACAVGVAMSTHFLIDSSLAKAEESDLKRLDRPACGGALGIFFVFWHVKGYSHPMVHGFLCWDMISRSTQLNHQPIDSLIGADEFW